ncbi:MAG: DMT family transporter [Paracoccus sp. (in: a-proteobacteria)]|nr:DMT family transporter [Paracoccus sp. (in: a-proteobacteria)]
MNDTRSTPAAPPPATRAMTPAEWSMLLVLSVLWGGSFFFNDIALRELPVMTVVAARVVMAAAVLWLAMRVCGLRMARGWRIWAAFLGMGLLNNVIPFSLIVAGQQYLASGVASILNAATPLFGVMLAHYLTPDERLTPARLTGAAIGFCGVVVMIGPMVLQGAGGQTGAYLLCLGGAFSYALAGIYGRRFRRLGVAPMAVATGQITASALVLMVLAALADRPWLLPVPGAGTIAALAGVAVLSTALAYLLYFRILATAGATNLLLVTLLIPVSAILLGTVFLNEVLMLRHMAGMALIGLGLVVIDGRALRRK